MNIEFLYTYYFFYIIIALNFIFMFFYSFTTSLAIKKATLNPAPAIPPTADPLAPPVIAPPTLLDLLLVIIFLSRIRVELSSAFLLYCKYNIHRLY